METYIITSTLFGTTRLFILQTTNVKRVSETQRSINQYNALITLCDNIGNTGGVEHNTINKLTYMDYVGLTEIGCDE